MAKHFEKLVPCPFLPKVSEPVLAAEMKRFGKSDRGAEFYETTLRRANSFWLQGFPAQAILQLNRAFGADLKCGSAIFAAHPLPYEAMAWIMANRTEDQFIGNPRRHFQHYATRMNEPRRELRTWRAWACWYLACQIFSDEEYPADQKQIDEEGIFEPSFETIYENLELQGIQGESLLWQSVAESISQRPE